MPMIYRRENRISAAKRKEIALEALESVGLAERVHHLPSELSGGQQQRVAIARALANNPPLLLCDEPTGSLDTEASETVMQALRNVQRQMNTTVIIVTHNMDVASQMDRLISLVDGQIARDTDPRSVAQLMAVNMLKEKRATGEMPVIPPHS